MTLGGFIYLLFWYLETGFCYVTQTGPGPLYLALSVSTLSSGSHTSATARCAPVSCCGFQLKKLGSFVQAHPVHSIHARDWVRSLGWSELHVGFPSGMGVCSELAQASWRKGFWVRSSLVFLILISSLWNAVRHSSEYRETNSCVKLGCNLGVALQDSPALKPTLYDLPVCFWRFWAVVLDVAQRYYLIRLSVGGALFWNKCCNVLSFF